MRLPVHCILAHVYRDAKESAPHDHGPTWAIYGQAFGETVMSDWDKLAPASEQEPGKVRLRRQYTLTPGMAYVYNEGDLHSPRRDGPTRLIRIEGRDVANPPLCLRARGLTQTGETIKGAGAGFPALLTDHRPQTRTKSRAPGRCLGFGAEKTAAPRRR